MKELKLTNEKEENFYEILKQPVNEFSLEIDGNKKTKESFIFEHFDFSKIDMTVDAILMLQNTKKKLMNYGIFKSINIECDRGRKVTHLDIKVHLEEKKRYFAGSIGAETSSHEILGKIGWGIRNFGGCAESLLFEASGGGQNENNISTNFFFITTTMFTLTFQKPRILSSKKKLIVQFTRKEEDHTRNSSYKEDIQSFNLSAVDDDFIHRFSYICDVRMLHPTKRNDGTQPSPSILFEGREPSLKSSLLYEHIKDQRSNLTIPTKGLKKSINVEFAGLGGNVQFLKTISSLTYHRPVGIGILNIGFHCGFICTLSSILDNFKINAIKWLTDKQIRVNDRLQIPGKLVHRGYHYGKIGDKDRKDYLNGDKMFVTGLSYSFPFGHSGLGGHLFFSTGSIKINDSKTSIINNFRKLFKTQCSSLGISIIIPLTMGRLEFGIAVPYNKFFNPFSNIFWGIDVNFL